MRFMSLRETRSDMNCGSSAERKTSLSPDSYKIIQSLTNADLLFIYSEFFAFNLIVNSLIWGILSNSFLEFLGSWFVVIRHLGQLKDNLIIEAIWYLRKDEGFWLLSQSSVLRSQEIEE